MKSTVNLLFLASLLTVVTTSYAYGDDIKMNDSMMHNNMTNEMVNNTMIDSPLKQIKHGILPHDVKCNAGFILVLKSDDGSPACVKASSVNLLVMRGWAMREDSAMKTMSQNMTNMHDDTMKRQMANETMKGDESMMNNMENKSMSKTLENNMSALGNSHKMQQSSMDESKYPTAPKLVGISDYINTTPASLAQEMKGSIVVYDFWTFNCINCIHTLPHVVDLYNKYAEKGVLVVGVHSPETFFEKDPNNVLDAVHKYGIKYPVVTDNQFQTWNAFGNHYWPHIYIADAQGKIRYDHIGEGNYDEIDQTVENLLLEQEQQRPNEPTMS